MSKGDKSHYLVAVGLDGSDASWKAFDEALAQSKQKDAQLHVISVQEHIDASYSASEVLAAERTAHENLERLQAKARTKAEEEGLRVSVAIVTGSSSGAMVDYVKKHSINLLVVGDTGHSSIWGALLGNTADKIVRSAPCSVLIVR